MAEHSGDDYDLLFRSLNGGLLLTEFSASGTAVVLRFNDDLCRLLGYTRDQFSHVPPSEWSPTTQVGSTPPIAQHVAAEAVRWPFSPGVIEDVPLRHKDGRSISTEISTQRFTHRRRVVALSVIRDMRERKTAMALRESNAQKDEFLATLAHELRNPLAPLRHGLDLLNQPDLSAQILEQTRTMMGRQLTQLVRLIDDLLDVSRINLKRLELHQATTLVSTLVATADEMTRPTLARKAQHLVIDVPVDDIWVDADQGRMVQVLVNLLDNAAKFSGACSNITLTVRRDGSDVYFLIEDQGAGMSEEFLPRAFELFAQGDRSLERAHGGLGIGLFLVKTLVEMHGGRVTASSAGKGRGSEFSIHLPVGSPPQQPVPGEPASLARVHSIQRRVLVADDNADSANMLAGLLTLLGSDVRKAFDGPEALALAAVFRPDVVLLDIGMPIVNGYEVCRRLRSTPLVPSPVLIAITGLGQPEDRRLVHEAGFDHHLIKPIEIDALVSLLASLPSRPRR